MERKPMIIYLDNLKRNFEYMEQNKKELKNQEKKKQEKEQAFEKLIENERENAIHIQWIMISIILLKK